MTNLIMKQSKTALSLVVVLSGLVLRRIVAGGLRKRHAVWRGGGRPVLVGARVLRSVLLSTL